MFRHSRGCGTFGAPGVSPSGDNKAILLLLQITCTCFQKENIPIVQATVKSKELPNQELLYLKSSRQ